MKLQSIYLNEEDLRDCVLESMIDAGFIKEGEEEKVTLKFGVEQVAGGFRAGCQVTIGD